MFSAPEKKNREFLFLNSVLEMCIFHYPFSFGFKKTFTFWFEVGAQIVASNLHLCSFFQAKEISLAKEILFYDLVPS